MRRTVLESAEILCWASLWVTPMLIVCGAWKTLAVIVLAWVLTGLAGGVTPAVNCLVLALGEQLVRRRGKIQAARLGFALNLGPGAAHWVPRRHSWGWRRVWTPKQKGA